MISAMAVPSFMAIPSLVMADVGLGLCRIVGTGIHQSVKRARRLVREALICILMMGLPHPLARRIDRARIAARRISCCRRHPCESESRASDVGDSRTLRKRHIG